MQTVNQKIIDQLVPELSALRWQATAIALDFDGVCKLFAEHKHQIMFTCLFVHLSEFQRVPFKIFREAYQYINFRSPQFAGKERFLCVNALALHLAEQGYNCALPGLHQAVAELQKQGLKIAENNLVKYQSAGDVARAIAWSQEVNRNVAGLTEIGLTPGIKKYIFDAFRLTCDFYVVSTAAEKSLPPLLEKESIDFILRYLGQETSSKAESLMALCQAGYHNIFMFGDSVEDSRAAATATGHKPENINFFFVPVIPGQEERCFTEGHKIIRAVMDKDLKTAEALSGKLAQEFSGKEVVA